MLRTRTTLTVAVATLALSAPATTAAQVAQDLRSPDARDASPPVEVVQDLRSPDARDAAVVPAPQPPTIAVAEPSTGFGWGDAGIGAAGMLGLILGIGGVAVLVAHHRRPGVPAPTR